MTLFEKIKTLAKKQGLSLLEVNDKAGLGKYSIYNWRKKDPTIDNLKKVANVLHTSIDNLLDDNNRDVNYSDFNIRPSFVAENSTSQIINKYSTKNNIALHSMSQDDIEFVKKLEPHNYQIRIPILGKIACGDPILAEQNIIGYRDLTFDHKPNGTLFLLKCQGHSMEPLIPDGSLVTIRSQDVVENGELAAVLIDDGATIKRIKYAGKEIILTPENRKYDPIILNESNPGRIIGKVIHVDYDVE